MKALSSVVAVCGVAALCLTPTALAANAKRTVVEVTDFGADRTGKSDSAAGIAAAIAHAKKINRSGEQNPVTGQPYWTGTNSFNYAQVHDPRANRTWRTSNPVFENVDRITDVGGRKLRIVYRNGVPPTDHGYVYVMREDTRDTPAALFWESARISVDHMKLGYLHGCPARRPRWCRWTGRPDEVCRPAPIRRRTCAP